MCLVLLYLVHACRNLFPRNPTRVFYCFWHLRTCAEHPKRRPETAESLEKARFSRECRKNGSFQGLKFPETIRFHKRNSSNDLSLDRGLIQ